MRNVLSIAAIATSALAIFRPAPQISGDVREVLSHFSMVDLPIDGLGNTVRTIRISGTNLQIVNGLGATDTVNALGSLIIGYNDNPFDESIDRTGSHCLVLGQRNGYVSYGGIVAGVNNRINGPYASVANGTENFANGFCSIISGGNQNDAIGTLSSVSGGALNLASGPQSWVGGGQSNTASGSSSSVAGGVVNDAAGKWSAVTGGSANAANGESSTVSGGSHRTATGTDDWRAGSLFEDQ